MTNWALGGSIEKVVQIGNVSLPWGSAANTKGAWTSVTSGIEQAINGLFVETYSSSYENHEHLADIGIGSTPDTLVENIQVSREWVREGKGLYLPLYIAPNTEIQARQQTNYTLSNSLTVAFFGYVSGRWQSPGVFNKCYTYGADTSDTGGLFVDPGGTADTMGSYVEFISALPETIGGFSISVGCRNDFTRSGNIHWYVDVAKGASGYEETLLDRWHCGSKGTYTDSPRPQFSPFFPIKVENGERIAIRCQCTATTSDRYIDVTLYCFA